LSGLGWDAAQGSRRRQRVEGALKLEPGAAAKTRGRLGELGFEAFPDFVGALVLGRTSHFKAINDAGPQLVTADRRTHGKCDFFRFIATLRGW
jgi:hypothetical protein